MAIQAAGQPVESVQRVPKAEARNDLPDDVAPAPGADEALEFVRFCYRRRRVGWPALYDEMCAVASRGLYKGMGYADLAEHGVSFCLSEMPRLVTLTERVVAEERNVHEPAVDGAPMTLTAVEGRA